MPNLWKNFLGPTNGFRCLTWRSRSECVIVTQNQWLTFLTADVCLLKSFFSSRVIFLVLYHNIAWWVVGGCGCGQSRFPTLRPQVLYLFGIVSPNGAQICRKKFIFSQQAKCFFSSDFLSKVQNLNCPLEGINCMVWNFFLMKVVCICLKYQEPNRQPHHSTFNIYHNMLM